MSNDKALSAYRMYLAVKLHFMSDSYDITKSRDNVRVSRGKFDERNQHALYEKFADRFERKSDMAQYLVANFAYGAWGNTDIIYGTAEAESNHKTWIRRKQSMTQVFKTDLNRLALDYETKDIKFLDDFNSSLPHAFQLFLGNHITIETLALIDKFHPYLEQWKGQLGVMWKDELRRIIKAKPFISANDAMKPIFVEFKEEH